MENHHAILIVTDNASRVVAEFSDNHKHDTEIVLYEMESLTIDNVRHIIAMAYQMPGAHKTRTLVVSVRVINREAQHALLKVLEEPPVTTRFLLVLPTRSNVLSTVLSRVQLEEVYFSQGVTQELFKKFCAAEPVVRLETIADIAKRKADNEYDALYDGLVTYGLTAESFAVQRVIEPALRYLRQKGAAKKMIWEFLALSLPVTKDHS
jgi:DNA polymerase III delta prime subunit